MQAMIRLIVPSNNNNRCRRGGKVSGDYSQLSVTKSPTSHRTKVERVSSENFSERTPITFGIADLLHPLGPKLSHVALLFAQ